MALTTQQTQQLDIASQRKLAGTASKTDISNLDYATKNLGYAYKPSAPQAPSVLTTPSIQPNPAQPVVTTPKQTVAPVFNKTQIEQNLKTSLASPDVALKQANSQFINAATRLTEGRNATPEELASPMTVADAVKKYKLESYAPNMGVGFGQTPTTPSGDQTTITPEPTQPTITDPVLQALDAAKRQKAATLTQAPDLNQYQTTLNEANMAALKAKREIENKKIIDAITLESFHDKPIPAAAVLGEQNRYNREQQLGNLMAIQDYNDKLLFAQMAEGNFLKAQEFNQQIEANRSAMAEIELKEALRKGEIEQIAADKITEENDYRRKLASAGYIYISDPSKLKGLTEKDLYRDPVSGRIYKKPVQEVTPEYQYTSEGIFNKTTGTLTPIGTTSTGGGVVSTSTGDAYDISSYATDPNHETAVQSILNNIGKFYTVQDMNNYIKKVAPNSPITGEMVSNASKKYGVSWEAMVAMMQQDSNLGTAGVGARTYNPGNVGNTDSGATRNYGNWQAGVDAVGSWLAKHKTEGAPSISDDASSWVDNIMNGRAKLSDVPAKLKTEVSTGLSQKTKGELTQAQRNQQEAFALVQDMINDPAREMATGGSSWWSIIPGSRSKTFAAKADRLLGLLTLDNIKQMKGMGALSDAEGKRLEQSAAILRSRSINQEDYLKELKRVAETLNSTGSININAMSDEDAYQLYLQATQK